MKCFQGSIDSNLNNEKGSLSVRDNLAKNDERQTASEIASDRGHAQLAMLIDAYAFVQSGKKALDSVVSAGALSKRSSIRV